MRKLDETEKKIVQELIRNTRISDNQISKNTGIPVMTVNRKRKRLEEDKMLRYYTSIDKGEFGLDIFGAKQLYIIKMKAGITRQEYTEKLESNPQWKIFSSNHISLSYIGEKDGHLALILILDAKDEDDLVEEFNGKVIKSITEKFGDDCIVKVTTTQLSKMIRVHHNYLPAFNMEKGTIKKDWPNELIFVDNVEKFNS